MKKKFKIMLLGLIVSVMIPSIVDAGTLKLTGSSNGSVGTYTVQYSSTDAVSNINFDISFNDQNITASDIKVENLISGKCDAAGCYLSTENIDLSTPVNIAKITITNNSSNRISGAKLTVNINGETNDYIQGIDLEPINVITTETPKTLSKDATLSDITVSIGTFDQAFNKDINSYVITGIKDTVNSVKIYHVCDNNCNVDITCPTGDCTISNRNKVSLRTGANQVGVNVTSEDGTSKKTYILNIYRGEIVTNSAYLSSIKIKDAKLSPTFDSLVNDYTTSIGLDVEKLDLDIVSEDPNANIVIKGNEKLKKGENTVTITVTSSDGENKQVYTIIVTKEKQDDEDEKKVIATKKVKKQKNNTLLIVILSIVGLGLIFLVYYLLFLRKKKKNKNNDKNDSNDGNTGEKEKIVEEGIEEVEKEIVLEDLEEEPKQDVDEALDDLMKTKKLELGDLDL